MKNIILQTDSYKLTQFNQYPQNMTYMHDYMESRGNEDEIIQFFGLQYYLKEYLTTKVTHDMVDEAAELCKAHGINFNYEGWEYIVHKLDGKLPIRIRALPEGIIINKSNVILTIESTDEHVPWIVTWVETLIMKVWYPTTVATLSYNIKTLISQSAKVSMDNEFEINHMFHNFGYRGVSSEESALIGSMGHLLNFNGTDTIAGIVGLKKYYNSELLIGKSIPASEHSTIISWTKMNEIDAYNNLLDKYMDMPVSIVLDSYDYEYAIEKYICQDLKSKIIKRNHFTYLRPDSGDALKNIEFTLNKTASAFGYKLNQKGFKVINNIRIIQGDGVNYQLIKDIMKMMIENEFSIENVSFGSGGALLQGNSNSSINRDTHNFAVKCSALKVKNESDIRKVAKAPKADAVKKSKMGRLDLIIENDKFKTVDISHLPLDSYHENSFLDIVFEDGSIIKEYSYKEIVENSKKNINQENIQTKFSEK